MSTSPPRASVVPLGSRVGHRGRLVDAEGRALTWEQVLADLLTAGPAARELERAITSVPWSGVFWECAPVVGRALDVPFRWVVLESAAVARLRASPRAFAEPMAVAPSGPVAVFPNLGRDALLVAPRPGGDGELGGHLVDFLRTANGRRRRAFWQAVAAACLERLSSRPDRPTWLSTSGLGVPWLHVRLDDRPKYVSWEPFRRWPQPAPHESAQG